MSERQIHRGEHAQKRHEAPSTHQHEALRQTQEIGEAARRDHEQNQGERLKNLNKKIDELAISGKELAPAHQGENTTAGDDANGKLLQLSGFHSTLRQVQRKLHPSERKLSKIIHQPTVEKISEVGSKTIARPTSILTGSVITLILTTIAYIYARQIGFRLNLGVFPVIFVAGYFLGLVVDVFRAARQRRKTVSM